MRPSAGSRPRPPNGSSTRITKVSSAPPSRALTVGSAALTAANSPNHVRSWSTMCEPDAPSQPPPRGPSNHQRGTAASGSATIGTNDTSENVRGSPITPCATARATSARSGDQRNSWPTRCVTRDRSAAASMRVASAASSANGFSHTTCRPDSQASIASAACVSGGVAIVTASTPSSASASVNDAHTTGMPRRSARRCVRAASRPTSACTVKPALRSAGTCTRQPKPVPTTTAPGINTPRPGRRRAATAPPACTARCSR